MTDNQAVKPGRKISESEFAGLKNEQNSEFPAKKQLAIQPIYFWILTEVNVQNFRDFRENLNNCIKNLNLGISMI